MKKTWLLMAFAAILAFPARAAEPVSPAAEKRVLPWQTMRGYKAFVDVAYGFAVSDDFDELSDKIIVSTSHGYQFSNFFYLGGGMALEYYTQNGWKSAAFPFFVESRINLLSDKRLLPFISGRAGYTLGCLHGAYFDIQLGGRLKLKQRRAVYAAFTLSIMPNMEGERVDDTNGLGIRVGLEF